MCLKVIQSSHVCFIKKKRTTWALNRKDVSDIHTASLGEQTMTDTDGINVGTLYV